MFKLLRYYAAASLVAVLATAVLLTWFYRQVSMHGIVRLAERNNMNLAQLAMNPIKPVLLTFLDKTADVRPGDAAPPLPPELARSISTLMHEEHSIARIKIYNRGGVVVFSTSPGQVGDDQSRNPGFATAIRGGVGSELIYRDALNHFEGVSEHENLMQTYLPVRAGPTEPIRGVFELYADVDGLVRQTERTEFIVLTGAILIMSVLYAVLILVVRHANNIIEVQQRTISERNETLARLADRMLRTEELHKQKIAFELHEGVAQTLAALKIKAESGKNRDNAKRADSGSANSMIPMLQEAIQEVRAIATELRPASLDDLGLLPTLDWLCREFEQRNPGLSIDRRIDLREQEIPVPLKGIVYGIIVSMLKDLAHGSSSLRVRLALTLDGNELVLLITDTAGEPLDSTSGTATAVRAQSSAGFARMQELTTLSGGAFTVEHHADGGSTLRAAWSR